MKIKILVFTAFVFSLFTFLVSLSNAEIVTIGGISTSFWWNDSVTVSGTALYKNGTTMNSNTVNVTLGATTCNTTTDGSGAYSCTFRSPRELGVHNLTINVTNSTGSSVINATEFVVRARYGDLPTGATARSVYEVPMLMQEPSGRIRVVFVRIIAWKSSS